jgi:hypothetical protein
VVQPELDAPFASPRVRPPSPWPPPDDRGGSWWDLLFFVLAIVVLVPFLFTLIRDTFDAIGGK